MRIRFYSLDQLIKQCYHNRYRPLLEVVGYGVKQRREQTLELC